MNQLTNKMWRKSAGACFLFLCLFAAACGNSNTAESTQPDPGLNAEDSTAGLEQTKK